MVLTTLLNSIYYSPLSLSPLHCWCKAKQISVQKSVVFILTVNTRVSQEFGTKLFKKLIQEL